MADFPTLAEIAAEHQYVVRHWGDGYTAPQEEFIGCSCNVEYWGHIQHADCTCYEDGFFDEADDAPNKHVAHVAAEWVKARTIANPNDLVDLDILPSGTVVRSGSGTIAARFDDRNGVVFGDDRPFPWYMLSLPVQILWHPGDFA